MVKGRGKESVQVWETFIEQGRLDEKKEMREILEAGLKRAKGIRRPEHSQLDLAGTPCSSSS